MSGEGGAPTELPPSYPNYADKHRARPVVTPADMLAWRRDQQRARAVEAPEEPEPPRAAVLTYRVQLSTGVGGSWVTLKWIPASTHGVVLSGLRNGMTAIARWLHARPASPPVALPDSFQVQCRTFAAGCDRRARHSLAHFVTAIRALRDVLRWRASCE